MVWVKLKYNIYQIMLCDLIISLILSDEFNDGQKEMGLLLFIKTMHEIEVSLAYFICKAIWQKYLICLKKVYNLYSYTNGKVSFRTYTKIWSDGYMAIVMLHPSSTFQILINSLVCLRRRMVHAKAHQTDFPRVRVKYVWKWLPRGQWTFFWRNISWTGVK